MNKKNSLQPCYFLILCLQKPCQKYPRNITYFYDVIFLENPMNLILIKIRNILYEISGGNCAEKYERWQLRFIHAWEINSNIKILVLTSLGGSKTEFL